MLSLARPQLFDSKSHGTKLYRTFKNANPHQKILLSNLLEDCIEDVENHSRRSAYQCPTAPRILDRDEEAQLSRDC